VAANSPDSGVPAEFLSLLTGSQRKLYAFIRSLVGQPDDADDILQESNVAW